MKAQIIVVDGLVKISTTLTAKTNLSDTVLSLFLDRDTGEQVYRFSTDEKTGSTLNFNKGDNIKVDLNIQDIFPNGVFTLRASLKNRDRTKEYALHSNLAYFEVERQISSGLQWDIHWQPKENFSIESHDSEKK
jgi:ABC-2 type transport system ATP-binding protein